MTEHKFDRAIKMMDELNARDPGSEMDNGRNEPEALVYAKRMTRTLDELYPDASEALKLAVRAQHIERWKLPRSSYPEGRAGYHQWRNDLKIRHAKTASEILKAVGYDEKSINQVSDLISKKNLKTQQDAQALEDVACIVFFKFYALEFASKHEPEKIDRIVKKTIMKMSPQARQHIKQLDLPAPLKSQLTELLKDT